VGRASQKIGHRIGFLYWFLMLLPAGFGQISGAIACHIALNDSGDFSAATSGRFTSAIKMQN
jgi:hypothetical protein